MSKQFIPVVRDSSDQRKHLGSLSPDSQDKTACGRRLDVSEEKHTRGFITCYECRQIESFIFNGITRYRRKN
jgi:hypothetical protein